MNLRHGALTLVFLLPACSDGGETTTTGGTSGTASSSGSSGASADPTTTGDEPTTATPTSSPTGDPTGDPTSEATTTPDETSTTATVTTGDPPGTTTSDSSSTGETSDDTTTDDTTTGGGEVYDPDLDGPWTFENLEGSYTIDGVKVPTDVYYPTGGPTPGPYPVVLISHGFQLPASQYINYAKRLASHGYVALTVDFQAGFFNPDHVAFTKQVVGGIDWVAQEATLKDLADTNNVGLTGHSLGGKLSIFGAVMDDRVRASITLDPVDSATMCDMQKCPDVSAMLPIDIPLGFVGETLDSMGGGMLCAPAADNFMTYYANATAPTLAVTVLGANHMSFIDDVDSCGFVCGFCKPATLENDVVTALARAYVVAFYGRHLKAEPGYDTYLTGAEAQARYVDTDLAEIVSK